MKLSEICIDRPVLATVMSILVVLVGVIRVATGVVGPNEGVVLAHARQVGVLVADRGRGHLAKGGLRVVGGGG